MIPLLFLNPQWVRENPVAAVLLAVIFVAIGMALLDWWRECPANCVQSGLSTSHQAHAAGNAKEEWGI
jgi:uncharacterized protein (DUF486 family)